MRKFSLVMVLAVAFTIPFPAAAHASCSQTAIVSGGSVTLCLSAAKPSATPSSNTKTITSVRTPTSSKPVCPGWVLDLDLAVAAILRGCPVPRLLSVAPQAPKPPATVSKKVTTTTTTTSTAEVSDQAAFTPNPINIVSAGVIYSVGDSVLVSSTASTHLKNATVLDGPAQVRFVPVAYRWFLDRQPVGTENIAVLSLTSAGAHFVELQVDYSASYRFDLAGSFTSVGLITVSGSTVLTATSTSPPRGIPHLVLGNCATHPSGYRC